FATKKSRSNNSVHCSNAPSAKAPASLSKPIDRHRTTRLCKSRTWRSNTASPRSRSPRPRHDDGRGRNKSPFQLGTAAPARARARVVHRHLAAVSRALFLHFPNCLSGLDLARAAAGASEFDLGQNGRRPRVFALDRRGRSGAERNDIAPESERFTAARARAFVQDGAGNVETIAPARCRSYPAQSASAGSGADGATSGTHSARARRNLGRIFGRD